MKYLRALLIIPILALVACANSPSTASTAQEQVYRAHIALNVALVGAIQYARLPRCNAVDATAPVLCSEQDKVDRILAAEKVAAAALDSAEKIVRDPTAKASLMQSAVNNAESTITALSSLIPIK